MNITKAAVKIRARLAKMEQDYPVLYARQRELIRLNEEAASAAESIEDEMDRLDELGDEWQVLSFALEDDAEKMWNLTEKTQIQLDDVTDDLGAIEYEVESMLYQKW